jgi:hypothetical protein
MLYLAERTRAASCRPVAWICIAVGWLCFGTGGLLRATDYSWQAASGSDGGVFNNPAHWSPTGFPSGLTDNANIAWLGVSAYSITLPDNNESVNALTLDSPNATLDWDHFNFKTNGDSDIKHGKVLMATSLWSNNGGAVTQTMTVEAPAFLTADSFTTIRVNLVNSGTTEVDGSMFLDNGTTTTTNNSTFTVKSAASLSDSGTFNQNGGTLAISSAGSATFTGAIFNFNGGSVAGTATLIGSTLNIGAGAGSGAFDLQFGNTLTGSVLFGQVLTIDSNDANGPSTLSWKISGFANAGQIIMTSAGTAAHNSTLSVASGNTLANSGEIDFQAGVGGTRFLSADAVNNSGTLNVNAPTNFSGANSALTNSGHIHIASGTSLTLSNSGSFNQTAGETQDDGTLAVTPGTDDVKIQGGILHGTGTVTGKLQVSGTGQISPGDSIGTLSVTGNVSFSAGSLSEELGTAGSPGTSDLLAITGNLTLSGTSALALTGGAASGYYKIITYSGTLSGTFNSVTSGYAADYSHTGEIRVVAVPLPGDYNGNGIVDAADYVVWRKAGAAAYLPNDLTPGTVNASDYDVWRAHFGQTAGSGSGASTNTGVPEPATLVLLRFVAAGLCLRLRRNA